MKICAPHGKQNRQLHLQKSEQVLRFVSCVYGSFFVLSTCLQWRARVPGGIDSETAGVPGRGSALVLKLEATKKQQRRLGVGIAYQG